MLVCENDVCPHSCFQVVSVSTAVHSELPDQHETASFVLLLSVAKTKRKQMHEQSIQINRRNPQKNLGRILMSTCH